MKRPELILILGMLLIILASISMAAEPFDQDYKLLSNVLGKFAAKGSVNYAGLTLDRAQLDEFIDRIGSLGKNEYEGFSMDQKRAFWINAYNAMVLRAVIDRYPIKKTEGYMKYPDPSPMNIEGFWVAIRFKSPLGPVTLSRIENDILPGLGQPFFLFAICNGTKGAPGLSNEPYLGSTLSKQLDAAASRFMRDPERVTVDIAAGAITLTKYLELNGSKLIGKFYSPDLYRNRDKIEVAIMNLMIQHGDRKNAAFIRGNRFTIGWKPLDWTLNDIL
jgi:hypothetical protein